MNSLYALRLPISVYFQNKNFQLFQFSIFTEFSLRMHKLGFFRFLHRLFRDISTKILLLLRLFSFVIYSNIFIFFPCCLLFNRLLTILRSFYFTVSVNIANTNFSRMTILGVVWLFTFWLFYVFPLIFYLKNFIQLFSYKSFSGVENIIPIPYTLMSRWASLSLDQRSYMYS